MKLQALRPATLLKNDLSTGFVSCEFCKVFKNAYFVKYLWMVASESV